MKPEAPLLLEIQKPHFAYDFIRKILIFEANFRRFLKTVKFSKIKNFKLGNYGKGGKFASNNCIPWVLRSESKWKGYFFKVQKTAFFP